MSNDRPASRAIAPTRSDLARAHAAADSTAHHARAEAVVIGTAGITVLCTESLASGRERSVLRRLSSAGELGYEQSLAPDLGAGRSLVALADGTWVIAGDVTVDVLQNRGMLAHVDDDGRVLASRIVGPAGVTGLQTLAVRDDGSLLCGGISAGHGWLLEAASTLEPLWEHSLIEADVIGGVSPDGHGGFAVVARVNASTTQLGSTRLALFSSARSEQWQRALLGEPAALARVAAGGYVIVGHRTPGAGHTTRCWVQKVDATGEPQWERLLGAADHEHRGRAVAVLSDGSLVVAWEAARGGVRRAHIALLSAEGLVLWEQAPQLTIDAYTSVRDIAAMADGSCIVVGATQTQDSTSTQAWLSCLHAGAVRWERVFEPLTSMA